MTLPASPGISATRRQFVLAGLAGLLAPASLRNAALAAGHAVPARYAYVGTYTLGAPGGDSGAKSDGLYVLQVDLVTGALSIIQTVRSVNPSFVCLDPAQRHLYVIVETDDYDGQKQGAIESYRIDADSGKLTFLNRIGSGGHWPADLEVEPSSRFVIVGNYGGGNYVVAPIAADGSLKPLSHVYQNKGSGPNAQRQEAPHPHSVEYDPPGRYIATTELGIDKVQVFSLDTSERKLVLVSEASVAPGAGRATSRSTRAVPTCMSSTS